MTYHFETKPILITKSKQEKESRGNDCRTNQTTTTVCSNFRQKKSGINNFFGQKLKIGNSKQLEDS